jgi:hypothetical protein
MMVPAVFALASTKERRGPDTSKVESVEIAMSVNCSNIDYCMN